MGAVTPGKRRDFNSEIEGYPLEPGEYGKNEDGLWFCCTPVHGSWSGGLQKHQVTEHDDGTITVSPSIWYNPNQSNPTRPQWHGFLERGIWREV